MIEENGAPAAEKLFVFYNPPVVNRNLGIRRSYIERNDARRAGIPGAQICRRWCSPTSRLHTEVLLTYLQQANPAAAGPGRADSRLSRRLSAGRAARNRARAARRPHSRRGRHERAGTGNRYRLARRVRDGRISGNDCVHVAARRTRRTAQRKLRARCWWRPPRRSINSSCSIPIIFSGARPSTRSSSRTIWKFW